MDIRQGDNGIVVLGYKIMSRYASLIFVNLVNGYSASAQLSQLPAQKNKKEATT